NTRFLLFTFESYGHLPALHSFPTRRSSDLPRAARGRGPSSRSAPGAPPRSCRGRPGRRSGPACRRSRRTSGPVRGSWSRGGLCSHCSGKGIGTTGGAAKCGPGLGIGVLAGPLAVHFDVEVVVGVAVQEVVAAGDGRIVAVRISFDLQCAVADVDPRSPGVVRAGLGVDVERVGLARLEVRELDVDPTAVLRGAVGI